MSSSTPDFDRFPEVVHGHQFEDFPEGREFAHHWGRNQHQPLPLIAAHSGSFR